MKIKLIAVGKVKEDYLKMGINEYIKRIKPYAAIDVIELPDSSIFSEGKEAEIKKAMNDEGKLILKNIKPSDYVINLDLNKTEYDSPSFASFMEKSFHAGGSQITFVIGGSYGLSDEVKKRANASVSLSKMTFLHQMTRMILLEQIYRSFKILNNEVYHK